MKIIVLQFSIITCLVLSGCAQIKDSPDILSSYKPIEVRFLEDGMPSPTAKIEVLSWMEGRWQSTPTEKSFSGGGDHVIYGPRDGQMPGLVRVMNKDRKTVMMFELSSFLEVDGTLSYRNRHFAPDMVAWQAPEEYVDRRLVALEGNTAYFHGISFVNRGPNKMGVSFVLTDDTGKKSKHNVDYTKVPLK